MQPLPLLAAQQSSAVGVGLREEVADVHSDADAAGGTSERKRGAHRTSRTTTDTRSWGGPITKLQAACVGVMRKGLRAAAAHRSYEPRRLRRADCACTPWKSSSI